MTSAESDPGGNEEEAIGRLFDRYYKRVRRVVSLRLGKKLRGVESETILRETFLRSVKSFDRFDLPNEATVINWLSRIAERAILDASQNFWSEKGREDVQVSMDGLDGQGPTDDGADLVTGALDQEAARIVDTCIGELPEEYREIIVLRDCVGYSWAEVAKEHGLQSEDAARTMHAKAMVELNRLMKERFPKS